MSSSHFPLTLSEAPLLACAPKRVRNILYTITRARHFYDIFRNGKRTTIPTGPYSLHLNLSLNPIAIIHTITRIKRKNLVARNKINVIFMSFHRYFLVPHTYSLLE